MALVAEANSIHARMGLESRFEVEVKAETTSLGYTTTHHSTVYVVESLGAERLASLTAAQFANSMRSMRARGSHVSHATVLAASALVDQWNVASTLLDDGGPVSPAVLEDAVSALREVGKLDVSFLQVVTSLTITFPTGIIAWPSGFLDFGDAFDWLNLGFVDSAVESVSAHTSSFDYVQTTILFMTTVACVFLFAPAAFAIVARSSKLSKSQRADLKDRTINMAVVFALLSYPILCARLLKLFHYREIGHDRRAA